VALNKPDPFQWTVNALANANVSNNIVPNGGYITSGQVLQSNGASSSFYTNTTNSVDAAMIVNQGRMTVTVPLDVNGIDVEQVLKDLMQVTGVVARNRQLEAKYKGLKESGERYQSLLQKVQYDANIIIKEAALEYRLAEEKYKTFEIIKDSK
jgi:hypothetical protein